MLKSLHNQGNQAPVFIFSCQSSGASLLRSWLDNHPAIACPPGLDLGPLCRGLEIALESTLGKVADASTPTEEKQVVLNEIRTIICRIMGSHLKMIKSKLWCDIASCNLPYLNLLQAVFPHSLCICLYRNCLDTVAGLIQAKRQQVQSGQEGDGRPQQADEVESMARLWLERTSQVFIFQRRHSADCLAVKYESLVAEPRESLDSITSFLGLDGAASLPEGPARLGRESQAEAGQNLLKSIPVDLLMKINRLMRSLGYPAFQPLW